jgi:hypothetical protein
MPILYDAGLVLAMLIGGAITLLVTAGYYERIASRRGEYEKDAAQSRAFYANLATLRPIKPVKALMPEDDEAPVA